MYGILTQWQCSKTFSNKKKSQTHQIRLFVALFNTVWSQICIFGTIG